MSRAKTQGGKAPRAATQSGAKGKRAATNGLFNELEAAIDALDADTSSPRHAGAKQEAAREATRAEAAREAAKVEAAKKTALPPPKRSAPGPTPPSEGAQIKAPFPPRTTPPKPPPGAERAAAIRARESRAQSEVSLEEIEEVAAKPAERIPPGTRPPATRTPDPDASRARPSPGTRPPATRTPDPDASRVGAAPREAESAAPRTAPPRPPPGTRPPPLAADADERVPPAAGMRPPPGTRPPELDVSRARPTDAPRPRMPPIGPPRSLESMRRPAPDADGLPRVTPPPGSAPAEAQRRPAPDADGLPRVTPPPGSLRASAPAEAQRRPAPDADGLPRVTPPPGSLRASAAAVPPDPEAQRRPAADADGLPRVTPPPGSLRRPPSDDGLPRVSFFSNTRPPEPARTSASQSVSDESLSRLLSDLDESGSREISESSGNSIDIDLEDSNPAARAYGAYDSGPVVRGQRPISDGARAISVGETAEEDLVIEGEDLPAIQALSIAIFEDPPQIAAAKQAIAVAGHKVVAAASGGAGIEQLKSLLRSGSAEVLLVGVPGGEELVDTALALAPRRPVVIAVTAGKAVDSVRRAASVGADLSISRPIDVERLAPVLFAATRLVAERQTATNARGSETMLRARLDALVDHEPGALQPFELFQRVLELELKRSKRYGYPIAVALFSVDVGGLDGEPPPPGVHGILRARAGNALIHSIRDIDLATELDQERFLVLLPYTTLSGAAEVARRILRAVTGGNPITAAGKQFPPKIVGAVAGALPGQPISFSRLMRDATQALEQARRDGAELAVPMSRGPES